MAVLSAELEQREHDVTWNYRIVDRGDHLALHEVHYDDAGTPTSRSAEPCQFVADLEEGAASIVDALERTLRDAREKPVLVDPWPEQGLESS